MKRIIVGMSGASGAVLGIETLRALRVLDGVESHLVMTQGAMRMVEEETDLCTDEVFSLADAVYDDRDMGALISSGSFRTAGMIVAPCSMKTLSGIANGYDANLLVRAADVCLKENRRVVLMPREMPLGKTHLRNMMLAAESGCCICPPVLTFYNHPQSIRDQVVHIVGKALMQFDLELAEFKAWQG